MRAGACAPAHQVGHPAGLRLLPTCPPGQAGKLAFMSAFRIRVTLAVLIIAAGIAFFWLAQHGAGAYAGALRI